MIQSITSIIPNGQSLTLELRSPEQSGLFVRRIDGLGPTKAQLNFSDSLYSDGSFFNSSRLTSRNIVLDLGFLDNPIESIENIRLKSYKFFPPKTSVVLIIRTDSRTVRTLAYVESNEPIIFSKESGTQISLICPDSYLYGLNTYETVFSGVSPLFEFPFENNSLVNPTLEFGNVFINQEGNIYYSGELETGLYIEVDFLGSVTNLNIHSLTTSQNMTINSAKLTTLTGSNFIAGDKLILSTSRNQKYIYLIRNGVWWNILNTIGFVSDWIYLIHGDNVITYTATSGVNNMHFKASHNIVYSGV